MTDPLQLARECGALVLTNGTDHRATFSDESLSTLIDRVRAEAMREQRENISDELSDALQSDLEHGVKWLNEKAAAEFQTKYPRLSKALSAAIAQQEQEGTK